MSQQTILELLSGPAYLPRPFIYPISLHLPLVGDLIK